MAQQQLRQLVPRRHQIPTDILTGPHQITGGFLLDARYRDRDDLSEVQQAGQMPGIAQVGLDPVPRTGAATSTAPRPGRLDAAARSGAGETEPVGRLTGDATGPGSDLIDDSMSL